MILLIVLFILSLIIISLIITFLYYIFLPTLEKQGYKTSDAIVSFTEKNYIKDLDEPVEESKLKAMVLCSCNKKFDLQPINFKEQHTCFMVKNVHGSGTDCKFACIGLGDCAKVCPQQAIVITNRTAVVTELCIGCGKCVQVCPQGSIQLINKDTKTIILCNNKQTEEITSCSQLAKEEKVEWKPAKHFKIWKLCYKIIKR